MNDRRPFLLTTVCRGIVRLAGLLVARHDRREWLAEWRGELHHVFGRDMPCRACVTFTLGAVPDALWMRAHSADSASPLESPRRCLAVFATLSFAGMALALLMPGVRGQIFPPAWHGPTDVAALSPVPAVFGSGMEVTAEQYLLWSAKPTPGLVRTAFYQPNAATVQIGGATRTWLVGRATRSLAPLLKISVSPDLLAACRRAGATPLILSRTAWLTDFGGDPDLTGRELRVGGRKAFIVAVAPESGSGLPLPMAAFTLESTRAIQSIAAQRYPEGYMLAQIQRSYVFAAAHGVPRVEFSGDDSDRAGLYVIGLSSIALWRSRIPDTDFLISLFIAGLVLPAIFSVSLRSALRTERLSSHMRFRSGLFLGAKIALLLPALYCLPIVLGHIVAGDSIDSAYAVQVFSTLIAAPLSALWIVRDQQQRCPLCLRRLSSPARVGERSRSLFSFSGVEYVCSEGHGLMHVPDFPTSWYPSQRWLSLDPSWSALFQHGR